MKKCELYEIKKSCVDCDLNDFEYGDSLEIWLDDGDQGKLIVVTFKALIKENDRYYYAIIEK